MIFLDHDLIRKLIQTFSLKTAILGTTFYTGNTYENDNGTRGEEVGV
jgi:hypothetical protein